MHEAIRQGMIIILVASIFTDPETERPGPNDGAGAIV